MWKLDNSSVIVLVSLLSGCIIYCTLSLAIIGFIISIIFVIYTCIVLLIDDSLVTRHAFLLLNYLRDSAVEFYEFIKRLKVKTSGNVFELFDTIKGIWRRQILERMDRRRNTYQLSSESFVSSRDSGDFEAIKGLSPIPKKVQSENNMCRRFSAAYESPRGFEKVTSTPMTSWKHRENGDVGKDGKNSGKKEDFEGNFDNSEGRNEDLAAGGGTSSPWGTMISPKMRQRAGGVKTVQTIAGPLLASTRYNIDTKTYADVTSPGLSSRLTKYATEANSKLIHSQYATGQFPRVNLNSSPTPLINSKTGKMRLPVTVRVAPPDAMNHSPRERQKTFVRMYKTKSPKTASPSVAQVLKEISLKRHASRDDIAAELIKKQRTDGIYSDELENLEEMTQKRGREESSRSDEDISIDNSTSRPSKRTKKPSCYDIINSLSSSTNVSSSSGVKRKADLSRSGTPDVGKHFKSFDSPLNSSGSPKIHAELLKINKIVDARNSSITETVNSLRQTPDGLSPKGILKVVKEVPQKSGHDELFDEKKSPKVHVPVPVPVPVKLTDRLFMREEPQNIDKLKTLINEHSSLTRTFSGPDGDEIKKSDIVNMRQTSMKAKLKSMFDAISGKTASKIDPNVVIQAEEVITSSANSPTSLMTLSSSTSTTNVNTSPISTSALVPIIGKSKSPGTPGKHVRWNIPDSSVISSVSSSGPQDSDNLEKKSGESEKPVTTLTNFTSPTTSAPPNFSFGSSVPNSSSGTSLGASGGFALQTSTSVTSSRSSSSGTAVPISNPPKFEAAAAAAASATAAASASTVPKNTQAPTFSFGTSPASVPSVPTPQNTPPNFSQTPQNTGFQSASAGTAATSGGTVPSLFGGVPKAGTLFAPTSASSAPVPASTTSSSTSNSMFSLGGSGTSTSVPAPVPKAAGFSFGATTAAAAATTSAAVPITASSTPAPSGTFAFGTNTTNTTFSTNPAPPTSTGQSGFSFGANAQKSVTAPISAASTAPAASATGFSFGGTAAANSTTQGFSMSSFGSTTAKPVFSFGAAAPSSQSPGTALTFGASTTSSSSSVPVPASSSASAPTLSFGAPASSVPAPTFGTPATTAPPAFGTPGTTVPSAFGTPTTAPPSAFGTPSTTAPPSAFGTPSTTAPPPAFGTPSTTAPSAFGTPATTVPPPAYSTQPTSSFGTAPAPIFGAPSTQAPAPPYTPTPNAPGSLSFGPPKTTATAFGTTTTTSSSLFNGASTTATTSSSIFSGGGSSGGGIFGQAKPPPAFGTTTTANSGFGGGTNFGSTLFGAQPTTTAGFGTNPTNTSTFGTANVPAQGFGTQGTVPAPASVPAFGNSSTTAPGFGASSGTASFGTVAPPAYGAQSSGATSLFNSGTPGFGGSGTTTAAPPAFGTATASTSGFGNAGAPPAFGSGSGAPPAFGTGTAAPPAFGSTSAAPPAFGSTSTSFSGFGTSGGNSVVASPFGSSAPNFGAASTPAPAFGGGGGGGGGGTSGGGFAFGGTASTSTQAQPQQNSMFSFGAGGGTSTGFQFNSTTPQAGFNFTGQAAPGTSNTNFSSPSPAFGGSGSGGMFSIGSGSTAPRSRSTRQGRKQR